MNVVFLDRDGVINRDLEEGYFGSADQLELLPGAREGVALLTEAGFRIVVVSNQQGVALGHLSPEELARMEAKVADWLGPAVLGFYHATGRKGEDADRKPAPTMLLRAGREHGFDPAGCFLVGDRESDMAAAAGAGARPLLVLTGKTKGGWEAWGSPPERVFADLRDAAAFIVGPKT